MPNSEQARSSLRAEETVRAAKEAEARYYAQRNAKEAAEEAVRKEEKDAVYRAERDRYDAQHPQKPRYLSAREEWEKQKEQKERAAGVAQDAASQ